MAPLTARIEAARYVIAVLIGEFPEQLGNELKKPKMLPALPGRLHAGLPIDLLRCRPDIAEGERELASATALIGVARPLCSVCCDWFAIAPIWNGRNYPVERGSLLDTERGRGVSRIAPEVPFRHQTESSTELEPMCSPARAGCWISCRLVPRTDVAGRGAVRLP